MPHQQTVISEQLVNIFFPKQFLAAIQSTPDTSEAISPSTPAPSIVPHPKLAQKLQAAREKLQQPDGPQILKILAYLRISCNLMQKMQPASLQPASAQDSPLTYLELVKVLVAHDRYWWTYCSINVTGCLRSTDAAIDRRLSPIEEFHQLYR